MAAETPAPPAAHEPPAVAARRVVLFALGFTGFAVLLGGGLGLYYRALTAGQRLAATPVPFPAPQLQPNPGRDWADLRKAQRDELESYGWVDPARRIVHVPIAVAMALVAARGAKAYDPLEGTPPFPPSGAAPLDGAPRAMPQGPVAPYGNVR